MKNKFNLILTRLIGMVVLVFVYYQTSFLSRILAATPQDVTPVWPPDGFATAATLLFGYWIWPGVFVGSFLANIWAFINTNNLTTFIFSFLQVFVIAGGTTLGTIVGAFLLQKSTGNNYPFTQLTHVIKFLTFTGMVGPIVNATVGVTALVMGEKIPSSEYMYMWFTWWMLIVQEKK
ncbi:MAG: hypothetical protein F6K62_09690 [Sphaerospermopsis sp. SIO1G2]|nr:hypothetical protein [Sphaerospermopsis sp. SIO1G2]